jgi:hypothetical protein
LREAVRARAWALAAIRAGLGSLRRALEAGRARALVLGLAFDLVLVLDLALVLALVLALAFGVDLALAGRRVVLRAAVARFGVLFLVEVFFFDAMRGSSVPGNRWLRR